MEKTRKTLRSISGIIKDGASLAKSSLSFNHGSTVVVKATTHDAISAPKVHRIDALLFFGLERQLGAAECIKSLIERLHKTGNTFVALKCLYVAHSILSHGNLTLRDHLSTFGGQNFLNLSMFRDNFNTETTDFSSWVRWYSQFLEQTMISSRVLGYYLYPPPPLSSSSSSWVVVRKAREKKIRASSSSDLAQEIEALVQLVILICGAPDSVHLQKNDLLYEIVRSIGEDYRIIRHEIKLRLVDLVGRLDNVNIRELRLLLDVLEQFEDCKGKLFMLFVNKASNDGLWEVITETKQKSKWIKMSRTNPFLGLSWTSSS